MTKTLPRGIRNNNPGNIRKSKDPWQGLADQQADAAFFQFTTPAFGIRALVRILITYQDKHGIVAPERIIARWAPATENDTAAYVHSICERCGFEPGQQLDLHRYEYIKPLASAIIAHENANYAYPESVIDEGLRLAGVTKPATSIAKDPKVIGATVVTVAAAAQQVATNVSSVWQSLAEISPSLPNYIVIGLGVVAVIVVAAFAVEQIVKRVRGIA